MIKVCRIGHATFETPDLDKAIQHYTQAVGLILSSQTNDSAYLVSRLGMLSLELQKGPQQRCKRLSFEVAAGSDLAAIQHWLKSETIESTRRTDSTPCHPEMLTFQDPKGTYIDLFTQWSFIDKGTDLIAGPLKFGHLAFVVPDPAAMAEFYQRIMGFRISDWIGDFFVFLRCNSDHHVVNFIRGQTVRMHHMAFELKDFAQIQNASELLSRIQIPIVWGPVRLGPGHNVAIFHRTADDHVLELYAELDQMKNEELGYWDPRPWHRDRPQRPKVWKREDRSIWGPPPLPGFEHGNFGNLD
jgi:catechol 2,3-dioxygenase-like lactoylglutathione lyase family enzyme